MTEKVSSGSSSLTRKKKESKLTVQEIQQINQELIMKLITKENYLQLLPQYFEKSFCVQMTVEQLPPVPQQYSLPKVYVRAHIWNNVPNSVAQWSEDINFEQELEKVLTKVHRCVSFNRQDATTQSITYYYSI